MANSVRCRVSKENSGLPGGKVGRILLPSMAVLWVRERLWTAPDLTPRESRKCQILLVSFVCWAQLAWTNKTSRAESSEA